MSENLSSRDEKIRSFWDRYVKKLYESGVKPPFDRWMVIRAEQYIAAHPGRRLAEHGMPTWVNWAAIPSSSPAVPPGGRCHPHAFYTDRGRVAGPGRLGALARLGA